jgi:hypothetical protein
MIFTFDLTVGVTTEITPCDRPTAFRDNSPHRTRSPEPPTIAYLGTVHAS